MHPDHARSFVLANSRGEGAGGGGEGEEGFAVRTPKYTCARVRMHTDKLRGMREGGREGRVHQVGFALAGCEQHLPVY